MYHIKNDKRCQRSAGLIAGALLDLLGSKPFLEITVSDIQRRSGVGRSTFYRLFDNIDDVVTYIVDEYFGKLVEDFSSLGWDEFTRECLKSIIERSDGFMNIITGGRTDLLIRSFRRNLEKVHRRQSPVIRQEVMYSFAIFSGACISIIRSWHDNGRRESVDELTEILGKYINLSELYEVQVVDPEE